MLKAYKYRLLPTAEQAATLDRWMGICRFVYNLALETKIRAWESIQHSLSAYDLMKQLTELKRLQGYEWIRDCSSQSLESELANLDKAYKGFFKGRGFPKFRKKSGRQTIAFRRDTRIENGKICVTKIGFIDFIQHRPLGEGEIRTCVISKTRTGDYYISVLIQDGRELPEKKAIEPDTSIGIDLGLKTFAVLSDGQTFDNPRFLTKSLQRLAIEQQALSRRYKRGTPYDQQSNRYKKQKLIVAKLHERISNQRKDFLQKVSTAITKQYDTICMEDLNIKGMIQNRKLSRAISDASWSEFVRMIEYKAEWYGKNVRQSHVFYPSSKTCSSCESVKSELSLSERSWTCESCGAVHDRDINAAINIKNYSLNAQKTLRLAPDG